MSNTFKKVFLIRFLGYFTLMSGIMAIIVMLGPFLQVEAKYRFDKALGIKHTVPRIVTSDPKDANSASFGDIEATSAGNIIPTSTEFGLVIEKINANAQVVADVDPANEQAYMNALKVGIAHAAGSNYPGEKGNIYMFSHSTDAPWNIVRFNAIFFLLRELEPGDKVIAFYKNKRYDYVVYDKTIAKPTDVSFLTNKYDKSVLTLQTCDPPGTTLNRLIVRAKLEGE